MEHQKRVATALSLLALGVIFYYYFGHTAILVLTSAASLVAYYEFLRLLLDHRSSETILRSKVWVSLGAASVMMGLYTWRQEWNLLPLYFCFLFFLLIALWLSHAGKGDTPELALKIHLRDAVMQVFGLFYITGFLSFVPSIHRLPSGPTLLLLFLVIVWAGDIGAYYGGKAFGRHFLAPLLSPKKTWEGAICGTLLCLLTCIPIKMLLLSEYSLPGLFVTALMTSIIAQAGDLLESLIKRVAHVKDSGQLFPGHGGAFDRFDSLILAAPIYYFFVAVLHGN